MRIGTATPTQVLGIVCVGIILANLDLFIVNVALPDIARSFPDATLEDLSWILNGYAIVYAALLVFFGCLAERHSRDGSFMLGVGLFTAASAAWAAATGIWPLVAFRILQAAGAALMTPTSLDLLLASFPPERRGGAVRTWTAVGGLGAALGPLLGGLLVTVDWRWIFVVNVPIGLGAMLLGWRLLPSMPGHNVPRPSAWAAALITGGIGLPTYAIIKVNDWGLRSWPLLGCVLLDLFVLHCRSSATPFIDPALFRIPSFTGSVLTTAPFSAALGGMLLSLALFEQGVWGFSALRTGLTIAPGPLLGAVPDVRPALAGMMLIGIGVGLTIPILMGTGLGALPSSSFATGSGVINMIRQAFIAVGVAALVAVLGQYQAGAAVGAFRTAWWMLVLLTLAGLVPTLLYLRPRPGLVREAAAP